jgi:1-deoxy-D-xylulose-5-phosphate reductoisomerase
VSDSVLCNVAVLGATGSIGQAALNVIRRHPERFRVAVLSAHRRAGELDELALEFNPDFVILSAEPPASFAPRWGGEWQAGSQKISEAAAAPGVDTVINALVGIAGLETTLEALRAGKRLALANKESLVAGGELVLEAWRAGGGELIPVDSEHSAVHQCLAGAGDATVSRLILTASGGPFRDWPLEDFEWIRPEDALAHPTWDMGAKISIDSATLANKALEVIEGHYLFGTPFERIDVVVHPSSVVHSMVEFHDGSTLAQLGYPTMEIPILYALGHPVRLLDRHTPFDPVAASPLVFENLRLDAFPMFRLGVEAGKAGGPLPVAFNAANEVVVDAFLHQRLGFTAMPKVVEHTLGHFGSDPLRGVDEVWAVDREARRIATESIGIRTGRNMPYVGG